MLRINKNLKSINKVCLSSSGAGRIEALNKKYLFSFESLYEDLENKWSIAVEIPLKGEELLTVQKLHGKYHFFGNFYKRIINGISSKKKLAAIQYFFSKVLLIAKLSENIDINSKIHFTKEFGTGAFLFKKSVWGFLKLKVSRLNNGHYQKLDFIFTSNDSKNNVYKMFLFLNTCDKK